MDSKPYTFRCPSCGTRNRIPPEKAGMQARCGRCKATFSTQILRESRPVIVTDGNYAQTVLQSPLPFLLFCWAPWCPTCGAVVPVMDAFAREARGRIRVGKLNVDQQPSVAGRLDVRSVPFLFVFENGKLVESMPGGMNQYDLMMKMARYL